MPIRTISLLLACGAMAAWAEPSAAQTTAPARPAATTAADSMPAPVATSAPATAASVAGAWTFTAPSALPPVTVRWEDPDQKDVFVVEGQRYQCRVATFPARILSLRVDGKDLLGRGGMAIGFVDANGQTYSPAPADIVPKFDVWRRRWVPAEDSRSRMNVWNAGTYYWDAHLLGIPLMTPDEVKAMRDEPQGTPLNAWSFQAGPAAGWTTAHNCAYHKARGEGTTIAVSGDDPQTLSPPVDFKGPVVVTFRMRSGFSGTGEVFWSTEKAGISAKDCRRFSVLGDGEWHTYRVTLDVAGPIKQLRFDPPGQTAGESVDLLWIHVYPRPKNAAPLPAAVRGEVVFHAYPDQLRIEFRVENPEGRAHPQASAWAVDAQPRSVIDRAGRPIVVLESAASAAGVLGLAGATLDKATGAWLSPLEGQRVLSAHWVIRPLSPAAAASAAATSAAFDEDCDPLPASAVTVGQGYWLGYDPASGLYRARAMLNSHAFPFEQAYINGNRRVVAAFQVASPARARNILVRCATGVGNLEAAVLADPHGFPLPVPVQVSKNFSSELEEPDDTGYGDSYFPLSLQGGERKDFQVVHLFQNWGNHPLKQVSSIRFFHIYWHLSTGSSESTCFTQDWMKAGEDAIFEIPDFRPLSGAMWASQPQHDCQQWPGFLQYNGKVKLMYDRTVFDSVSPNLARFTMHLHTSDDAATARVSVMESPHRDEMRTFLHLRYDWLKPAQIDGDARLNFRWLNLHEMRLPQEILWTAANGQTASAAVPDPEAASAAQPKGSPPKEPAAGKPLLLGEPLSKLSPFVASSGRGENYGCVVLVRSFTARLGGKECDQPAASAMFAARNGSIWLTSPAAELKLLPGDFIEADVMLMPTGQAGPSSAFKPERERQERFGGGWPLMSVGLGRKVSDFPACIQASDEAAQFTLEGGFDYMPLIVEGFAGPGVPLLWRDGVWQDQQVHGGDGYQVDADGKGGYRFTFVYPIRKGQRIKGLVTRADCSTGISRLYDINGLPALESPKVGNFSLKAPVLFAPGVNTITPGSPVVRFAGTAAGVRAVPIFAGVGSPSTVEVVSYTDAGVEIHTRGGPITLLLSQLASRETYKVSIDGKETLHTISKDSLAVHVPGDTGTVIVTRQP